MLIALLPLLPQAELSIPAGRPVQLDGRLDAAEWSDGVSLGKEGGVGLRMKRTGRWLALGITSGRPYAGEMVRLYVADERGTWLTALNLGIGQPTLPPALWRRAAPEAFSESGLQAECPRACRVRLMVDAPDRWSAEYLVALYALGIGRGDRRGFRCFLAVVSTSPDAGPGLRFPEAHQDPLDTSGYAVLAAPDEWGGEERWPPIPPEVSREFDDHELLTDLFREQSSVERREKPEISVIGQALMPRTNARIAALRAKMEAGHGRNPALPAWTFYRARLLRGANLFAEARKLVASVPAPVRRLDAFAALLAGIHADTEEWAEALAICRRHSGSRAMAEVLRNVLAGQRAWEEEQNARERDLRKPDPNPRIRIVTSRGEIVCELFENDAPLAVYNFVDLVSKGFYDGQRFHEVAGGAFAALGDPSSRPGGEELEDGPGFKLKRDSSSRALLRGALATVPVSEQESHGSQFTIGVTPLVRSSIPVAVFGRVVEGQEVVDRLEKGDTCERIEILRKRNHDYDPAASRIR